MPRDPEYWKARAELAKKREMVIKDKILDVVDDIEVPDVLDIIKSGARPRIKPLKWLRRFGFWLLKNS